MGIAEEPYMCDRTALAVTSKMKGRSRVTNGAALLAGIDGRSRHARRVRDVLDALLTQLDRAPTEADMILARRAADLSVWCEMQQAARMRGEQAPETVTATNALRRVLSDLGLSQRGKPRPRQTPRHGVAQ